MSNKTPTHTLFHITEKTSQSGSNVWTEIGAGWSNTDGSINLSARAPVVIMPGHSYQLRVREQKEEPSTPTESTKGRSRRS